MTFRMVWKQFLAAILIYAVSVGLANAQVSTGQILGTVTDPAGSVIPGASVTVTNVGTAIVWHTKTDAHAR